MEKIIEIKFGSHLYGTNSPESDLDLKGIYLPTGREIVLHSYKPTIATQRAKAEGERNTKDDVDTELFSFDRYLDLLIEGQTVALDMLFAPSRFYTVESRIGRVLMDIVFLNRHKLISKNVMAFVGYARQQASKYGIKGSRMDALQRTMAALEPLPPYSRVGEWDGVMERLVIECQEFVSLEKAPLVEIVTMVTPTQHEPQTFIQVCGRKIAYTATVKLAKECFGKILAEYGGRARKANLDGGIDWKALSHAVRVNSEAQELLLDKFITFPRPDARLLKAIKFGELPYEQVAEMIEEGLVKLYEAQAKSTLPEQPDRAWADDLIFSVYSPLIS